MQVVEIVTEVLAAGLLSMLAGIIALLNGAYVVGIVILATSISITSLWMIIVKGVYSSEGPISITTKERVKEKGNKIINQTNSWMEETCTMIRENIQTPESKKIFTISSGLMAYIALEKISK